MPKFPSPPMSPHTAEGSTEPIEETTQPEQPQSAEQQVEQEKITTKELIEKQREKAKLSMEAALIKIRAFLESLNVEELTEQEAKEVANMRWALDAAESAAHGLNDPMQDKYMVQVLNEDGNVRSENGKPMQREEGIPLDGIIKALDTMKRVTDQWVVEQKKDNADIDATNLLDQKRILNNLNTPQEVLSEVDKMSQLNASGEKQSGPEAYHQIIEDVNSMVEQWEQADRSNGSHADQFYGDHYSDNFRQHQRAEALKQILESHRDKERNDDSVNAQAVKEYEQLKSSLETYAKNYFDYHYGKDNGIGLTEAEAIDQNPYTKREANLIEKHADPAYRTGLVEKYGNDIPGFDTKSPHEQNYALAMLVLRDREVMKVPEAKPKKRIILVNATEIAERMAEAKAEEMKRDMLSKSGWLKRRWVGLAERGYVMDFYKKALDEIKSDNNLMKAIEGRLIGNPNANKTGRNVGDYYKILDGIIETYEHNLEQNHERGDEVKDAELATKMAPIFDAYARNEWSGVDPKYAKAAHENGSRAAIELFVRDEIAPTVAGDWGKPGAPKKDLLYASNFAKLAQEYKDYQEQLIAEAGGAETPEVKAQLKEHLDSLAQLDIQLGYKERDLYNNLPKGTFSSMEKAMNWAESHKFMGQFVANPIVFGLAAAVSTRIATTGFRGAGMAAGFGIAGAVGLSPFILPLVAGGAGIGAYMYYKRSKNLKIDAAVARSNEALGGQQENVLTESKGRFENMTYNAAIGFMQGLEGKDLATLNDTDKQKLAEIAARRGIEKSKGNQRDLFIADQETGARQGTVLGERNRVDILLKHLTGDLDLTVERNRQKDLIISKINDAENSENSYRKWQSWKTALAGGALAIGASLAAQEVLYLSGRGLGVEYFKNRGTNFERFMDYAAEKSDSMKSWWHDNSMLRNPSTFSAVDGAPTVGGSIPGTETNPNTDANAQEYILNKFGKKIWDDQPGRHGTHHLEFEGKQQNQYHVWEGKKGQGHITIDEARTMKQIHGNIARGDTVAWDKSTDPKLLSIMQEMKQHQAAGDLNQRMEVRVFTNNEAYKGNTGITAGHLDAAGKLQLTDELRGKAFDANGNQLARAIEVGYIDKNGTFHVLNTHTGKGTMELPHPPPHRGPGGGVDGTGEGLVNDRLYDATNPAWIPDRAMYGRTDPKAPAKSIAMTDAERKLRAESLDRSAYDRAGNRMVDNPDYVPSDNAEDAVEGGEATASEAVSATGATAESATPSVEPEVEPTAEPIADTEPVVEPAPIAATESPEDREKAKDLAAHKKEWDFFLTVYPGVTDIVRGSKRADKMGAFSIMPELNPDRAQIKGKLKILTTLHKAYGLLSNSQKERFTELGFGIDGSTGVISNRNKITIGLKAEEDNILSTIAESLKEVAAVDPIENHEAVEASVEKGPKTRRLENFRKDLGPIEKSITGWNKFLKTQEEQEEFAKMLLKIRTQLGKDSNHLSGDKQLEFDNMRMGLFNGEKQPMLGKNKWMLGTKIKYPVLLAAIKKKLDVK